MPYVGTGDQSPTSYRRCLRANHVGFFMDTVSLGRFSLQTLWFTLSIWPHHFYIPNFSHLWQKMCNVSNWQRHYAMDEKITESPWTRTLEVKWLSLRNLWMKSVGWSTGEGNGGAELGYLQSGAFSSTGGEISIHWWKGKWLLKDIPAFKEPSSGVAILPTAVFET